MFPDEYRLSDYAIGPEAKLNLVVRPTGDRNSGAALNSNSTTTNSSSSSGGSTGNTGSGVWQLLSTVLAKHFTPADAAKVQEQLIKVPAVPNLACSCTGACVCRKNNPTRRGAMQHKLNRLALTILDMLHFPSSPHPGSMLFLIPLTLQRTSITSHHITSSLQVSI